MTSPPRLTTAALICLLVTLPGHASEAEPASFDAVLHSLGMARSDLAVGGAPDWLGVLTPAMVPHRMFHLQPVLEDPPLLGLLGANLLGVAARAAAGDLPSGQLSGTMTAYLLHPRLAGFRGEAGSLQAPPARPGALTFVLDQISTAHGDQQPPATAVVMNRHLPEQMPDPGQHELALPAPLRVPVTELLWACVAAEQWIELSWEELPEASVSQALSTTEVGQYLAGGSRWWPAIDRAARESDHVARAHAGLMLANAVQTIAPDLLEAAAAGHLADLHWQVETRIGRVVVAGTRASTHDCRDDCLLVIDLGGNDTYSGSAAGARYPELPISVLVDLSGDDRYRQAGSQTSQGAGLGGVALLADLDGNDVYTGACLAQGAGLLGYGVLWDGGGDDRYEAECSAQGAAVFGGGLLLDAGGSDTYEVHGEGQGFGGPGGAGSLVDLGGDDTYFANPDPAVVGRADPHSHGRVAANNSQGAGVGRRGDLSDGHLWAGGLGVLTDLAGNDKYRAGNFVQGMGYFLGTGMLLDGGGDDEFHTVYFSQGSGLHLGLGLLLDRGGNDSHLLEGEGGASLGYGWDFGFGMAVDSAGDDTYQLRGTGLGCAERQSTAIFLDLQGNDTYGVLQPHRALGVVDHRPGARIPGLALAARWTRQAAVFVDLGGEDLYLNLDGTALQDARNGSTWQWPRNKNTHDVHNHGRGVDFADAGCSGTTPEINFLSPR